jgi:hypothetical protein
VNFKKIRLVDNWGHQQYETKGSSGAYYNVNNMLEKQVKLGKTWVKFPDGYTSCLKLIARSCVERVSDMGHEYDVNTTRFYGEIEIHKIKLLIPIERLQVAASAI